MSPSKYLDYTRSRERKQETHPVWRGVGFIIMILIPVMAYAAVDVLLKQDWIQAMRFIPRDLLARPGQVLFNLVPDPMINIKVILFLVFVFLFYILFILIGSLITSLVMGRPERRDPYYVAPMARPRRRR